MVNTSGLKRTAGPGRPKGSKNRKTKALREFFSEVRSSPEWQGSAKTRMERGKAPHLETLMVRDELGDPQQQVQANVTVRVVYEDLARTGDSA